MLKLTKFFFIFFTFLFLFLTFYVSKKTQQMCHEDIFEESQYFWNTYEYLFEVNILREIFIAHQCILW